MASPVQDWESFLTFVDARYGEYREELETAATHTDIRGELFTMKTGDLEEERMSSIGELGQMPEFDGSFTYDQQYEQYEVVYRTREYGTATVTTRRMIDDDRSGFIDGKRYKPFVSAAIKTEQYHATELLENMDIVENHYYSFSENQPLVSAFHTTRTPGVSTATGFDNIIIGPVSEVTIRAAIIQGQLLKNDRGDRAGITYDKVYAPPNLGPTLQTIFQTMAGLNTAFGNYNPESAKATGINRVVNVPLWSSTNRCLLVNSELEKLNQYWITKVATEYGSITEFDSLNVKMRAYSRHAYARMGWRHVMAIIPA